MTRFEKWQALGNAYMVIESSELPWELSPERIRLLCDPGIGVGTDGIVLVSPGRDPGRVADLRIFNPDGSEAGISGNGARIAALYLRQRGSITEDTFTIGTAAGPIAPTVTSPRTCSVAMGRAATVSPDFPAGGPDGRGTVRSAGRDWAFRHVAVGNPQCAIRVGDAAALAALDLAAVGPGIVSAEIFPNRSNVSFYVADGSRVRARIFERGVGETRSSGTGALGVAVAAYLDGAASPLRVELDGGELRVDIGPELETSLTGWAEPVLRGNLSAAIMAELSRSGRGGASVRSNEKKSLAGRSRRLAAVPPYPFATLEEKVAARRASGADVISLGIGDPDMPTYPHVVEAMRSAIGDPDTQRYPSGRGREEFRTAFTAFYRRRFGVHLDPETEVIPAIGAKECLHNLCLAFLDPGDVALSPDPGYPVYSTGPILAGAEPILLPQGPDGALDLDSVDPEVAARARLLFINFPNNPTGAVVPGGFFERVVEFARRHEVLVVHDNAYAEITYDGYVAPSFLATEGALEAGVEVYSLSKGFNMTGWRAGAILGNQDAIRAYLDLKSNIDSGLYEAIQLAAVAALEGPPEPLGRIRALYAKRRDLTVDALREVGLDAHPPKGTIYVWAPVPEGETSVGFCERLLEEASVVVSPGPFYGPAGEGHFRITLTTPDERLEAGLARMRSLLA